MSRVIGIETAPLIAKSLRFQGPSTPRSRTEGVYSVTKNHKKTKIFIVTKCNKKSPNKLVLSPESQIFINSILHVPVDLMDYSQSYR